jgi:hypothetical protein
VYVAEPENIKLNYNGQGANYTTKIVKAKVKNNNGDNDVFSDFGSERSRSSSFYYGNGTSN